MMIMFYIPFFYSLKRRKCDGDSDKHNFMERLLGAARLLAEVKLQTNIIVALNSNCFPYSVQ